MEEDFITIHHRSSLTDEENELLQAAEAALDHSYAPYSNFRVGAAVLLEDGSIITGVNQENAAYPSGLCAEQVALYRCGAAMPGMKVLRMAITARPPGDEPFPGISPCGGCRQVMMEFVHRQKETFGLIMPLKNGIWLRVKRAEALLPYAFGTKTG
jgi:cytidine deaminase